MGTSLCLGRCTRLRLAGMRSVSAAPVVTKSGYDSTWKRDIGYGVPAMCDHPGCGKRINRGLGYVCANDVPYGGDGCGLFFCDEHKYPSDTKDGRFCQRCCEGGDPFTPTPDVLKWDQLETYRLELAAVAGRESRRR